MQNQQDTMSNYTITSPISGTIIEKDAQAGRGPHLRQHPLRHL